MINTCGSTEASYVCGPCIESRHRMCLQGDCACPRREKIDPKQQLYNNLVGLCQQYGLTTEATYELLHSAVESLIPLEALPGKDLP